MERLTYYCMKGSENDGYFLKPGVSKESAVERLAAYEERSCWIPVSERLPGIEERVLVALNQGPIAIAIYFGDWELWADSSVVLAWMPLPEPYRQEEDV